MQRIAVLCSVAVSVGAITMTHVLAQSSSPLKLQYGVHPFGAKYLSVGDGKYRVYESSSAWLGSYGTQAQKPFPKALYFSRFGDSNFPDRVEGRLIEIDSTTKANVKAGLKADLPQVKAEATVGGGQKNATKKITASIWQVSSPEAYLDNLKNKFADKKGGYSSVLKNDNFRFIYGVIMTSNYETTSNLTFEAKLETKVNAIGKSKSGPFEATIGGDVSQVDKITLKGNNVIGYQWYAVCWDGGDPVSVQIHDFLPSANIAKQRPEGCKTYSESLNKE